MSKQDAALGQPAKVLIVGAGVAGLEAMMALRALAPELVEIELLAPNEAFSFRPMAVTEPFGGGRVPEVPLKPLVSECAAVHRRDSLAEVDPASQTVTTASGDRLAYDALLVAPGARPVEAVPGALTFGDSSHREAFAKLLERLGRRGHRKIAFLVPKRATWAIAAYELALLTAGEREARRLAGVELVLVTHEAEPLGLFGSVAGEVVRERLNRAGIELRTDTEALVFEGGSVSFSGGASIEVDHAVALPGLEVPVLPGLPQRAGGFLRTDVQMHVAGLERVWAAGDVTSFPVKQGGLAAQQADVAARGIATRAGARVAIQPFQPVLRGILITGGAPEFMRSELWGEARGEATTGTPLWWPASKIAGNHLGPYLSRILHGDAWDAQLLDVGPATDSSHAETDQAQAVRLVLAAAEADAARGRFESALWWLDLAEELNLVLPQSHLVRRYEWQRELDPGIEPDPAVGRMEPALVSAAAGISDLQRRIGWLRKAEREHGDAMTEQLARFDAGLEHLISLSKQTGNFPDRD